MKRPVTSRQLLDDDDGQPMTLAGLPIRVDETMPAEQIEIRRVKTEDGRLTEETIAVGTMPRLRRKRRTNG